MTPSDSVDFLRFLSGQAWNLSLAIGLKNSGSIIPYVLPGMQWEVNEQCVQYSECGTFDPFINANKPVFHIEYPSQVKDDFVSSLCSTTGAGEGTDDFSTVLKNYNLDGWVQYCNGMTATTPT
jgi:glycosyl hydrolase family 114